MILSPYSRFALMTGCGWLALSASPALATDEPAAPEQSGASALDNQAGDNQARGDDEDADPTDFGSGAGKIVVEGQRLRGQLDVEQAPILELDATDIAGEGVTSIAELIAQIENQTGSARGRGGGGRPVILINGIRVGSFREFANYPPEALERAEVFPEEVALRFGFPPDRRVINLILKENYRNAEVELEFEGPARGGSFYNEQELGFLQIADGARINFNFAAEDRSLLTEAERDIIQTPGSISDVAGDPDQAEFRSLVADSRSIEGSLNYARAFIDSGTSVSANINYTRNDTRRLQGLNTVLLTDAAGASVLRTFGEDTPLQTITAQDVIEASGSLTRPLGSLRLTSSFDAGLSESTQRIDNRVDVSGFEDDALAGTLALDGALPSAVDGGFDTAFTRSTFASSLTTLRGPIANLPGGELLATFDLGYVWNNQDSEDTRGGGPVDLTRGDLSTGMNLVIPITSRRNGFADGLGSFTLSTQVGLNHLSDFGTLGDYTLALNWSPFGNLDLSATYIEREVAPGLGSLGAPLVEQLNTPVFDFTTGETVLASVITGGNPDLLAETQRDWKFAANWRLPFWQRARFTVEYVRNRSDDVTSAFPQITPEIEAAFPDRITRDAGGTLLALDRRAVTYAETRAERLQFGLNFRGSIGAGSRGGPPQGARGGGGSGRPGGGGAPRGESQQAAPPAANPTVRGRPGAGGPNSQRRAAFMQLRARICAEDGLEVLTRLITALEAGEDVSAIAGDINPRRLQRMLSRLRDENGAIDQGRLEQMRERMCSMDPATMRGPPGAGRAARAGGDAGGPPASGPQAEGFAAFRAMACAPDGEARIRALVASIERGEDVSDELPGFDPNMASFMIDRLRGEDGTLSSQRIAGMRARFCREDGQDGAPGSGQGRGGPPGAGGPGFNPLAMRNSQRGFRYFFNINHTIELDNQILIAPGLAPLDQLDGQGTGAFGLSRHTSRLEAGIFGQGVGMRLSGRYLGKARLEGSGLPGTSDLFFDDLATFNIRMFADVGRLTGSEDGPLQNVRVSLRLDNVFDAQRRVVDANGDTPLNYQPFLIDPLGRYVGIDLRKLF